jgi:hypothetical protein
MAMSFAIQPPSIRRTGVRTLGSQAPAYTCAIAVEHCDRHAGQVAIDEPETKTLKAEKVSGHAVSDLEILVSARWRVQS